MDRTHNTNYTDAYEEICRTLNFPKNYASAFDNTALTVEESRFALNCFNENASKAALESMVKFCGSRYMSPAGLRSKVEESRNTWKRIIDEADSAQYSASDFYPLTGQLGLPRTAQYTLASRLAGTPLQDLQLVSLSESCLKAKLFDPSGSSGLDDKVLNASVEVTGWTKDEKTKKLDILKQSLLTLTDDATEASIRVSRGSTNFGKPSS